MIESLTSWGQTSRTTSRVWRAQSALDCSAALQHATPGGVIARGLGRSYGDACLNNNGDVIATEALCDVSSFDADSGVVACGAGVSFRHLTPMFLSNGWMPPVCPGTGFVTIGGAVANDVHGKNQHVAGSIGEHIVWIELTTPDRQTQRITAQSDPSLFAATVGGVGLTGIIRAVGVQMVRVPSNALRVTERRVPNLDAFFDHLMAPVPAAPYVVGWLDTSARGTSTGRGIIETAVPADTNVARHAGRAMTVPFTVPGATLIRAVSRSFNSLYYHRIATGGRDRTIHVSQFLYSLDAIRDWNRLYGRAGLQQFQCCLPFASARAGILELLQEVWRVGAVSPLGVLKVMHRPGVGMLSFAMPGITMALDFPAAPHTMALVQRLNAIALRFSGRIYLAKDSCLDASSFRQMYPRLHEFEAVRERIDPNRQLGSDMSRRLRL